MVILIIAVLFAFGETAYFGFNPHPASFAEWVCDMIALFLGFLGVCRIGYSRGQDAAKKEYEAKIENNRATEVTEEKLADLLWKTCSFRPDINCMVDEDCTDCLHNPEIV